MHAWVKSSLDLPVLPSSIIVGVSSAAVELLVLRCGVIVRGVACGRSKAVRQRKIDDYYL